MPSASEAVATIESVTGALTLASLAGEVKLTAGTWFTNAAFIFIARVCVGSECKVQKLVKYATN